MNKAIMLRWAVVAVCFGVGCAKRPTPTAVPETDGVAVETHVAPPASTRSPYDILGAPTVLRDTLIDIRDDKAYKAVKIGAKWWTAENLNYDTANGAGSWCYKGDTSNCGKYGRLYDWNTAQTACPAGWHLPSRGEWDDMIRAAGGESVTMLDGDFKDYWRGSDFLRKKRGFSARYGGERDDDGSFRDVQKAGNWWTSSETVYALRGDRIATFYTVYRDNEYITSYQRQKDDALSVRCVRDDELRRVAVIYDTLRDDRDGKKYKTAVIGGQTWMAENLRYRPQKGKSWCPGGDDANCEKYGRLYDWNTARTACPSGWHAPSLEEMNALTATAGGASKAGKALKAASGWKSGGDGADLYGFSALPGGCHHDGSVSPSFDAFLKYDYVGYYGRWWTATEEVGANHAYALSINYDADDAIVGIRYNDILYNYKEYGFSLRCVMGDDTKPKLKLMAGVGGSVSTDPSKASYTPGDSVLISAVPNKGYKFFKWSGGQVANDTVAATTITVYSDMSITAYFHGKLIDKRDGKTYKTLSLGGNVWMAENLNYVPPGGGSRCYKNDTSYCGKYGRLYDWNTATAVCPAGWRLPSDRDWTKLQAVSSDTTRMWISRLKSRHSWHYGFYGVGTDEFGFSALPGGRVLIDGDFVDEEYTAYWWTATECKAGANYWWLHYDQGNVRGDSRDIVYAVGGDKRMGASVRCVKAAD